MLDRVPHPGGSGRAFLAVHADGPPILVACPELDARVLDGPPRTTARAYEALIDWCRRLIDAANLVYPTAVLLGSRLW